jgi:hypothetical protein
MPATTPQLTVRPSGFARSVVQGWMNAQDEERAASGQVSDMHTEEEEELVELEARPDRLGLGAKFLSHNRAMLTSTTNAVGAQLSKKLRRYQPDEVRELGLARPLAISPFQRIATVRVQCTAHRTAHRPHWPAALLKLSVCADVVAGARPSGRSGGGRQRARAQSERPARAAGAGHAAVAEAQLVQTTRARRPQRQRRGGRESLRGAQRQQASRHRDGQGLAAHQAEQKATQR